MASAGAEESTKSYQFQGQKELSDALAEKEPSFTDINHFLSEFRVSCQNAIFRSLKSQTGASASAAEAEDKLWDMHVKINSRFRKLLSQLRDDQSQGKKRPVERRKLSKHYLNFITASQRFYCSYLQQLLSQYHGIPELEEVAKRFDIEDYSKAPSNEISQDLSNEVLRSCHATLIRLGDLSRYYGMELAENKNRKWDRAVGYYSLAGSINPSSGFAHNQLAVIALADGNHFEATYRLYRALSARDSHPTAKGNLELEFKKTLKAWKKGESLSFKSENASLVSSFLYLHAQCYKGSEFPEHDELENDILHQITVDIKERSLRSRLLQEFCLINISADANTQKMATEKKDSNANLYLRRLNVKTFFALLQVLLAELECSAGKVTVVTNQILPVLRHYSSWLLANSGFLTTDTEDSGLNVQIKEFWKVYANALTLLTSTFDVEKLPVVKYLLDEDVDTLGFAPFMCYETFGRFTDDSGQNIKPRTPESRRPANAEMLFRIRELVVDGLDLVSHKKIPIALVADKATKVFVCMEEGLPQFSPPNRPSESFPPANIERDDIQLSESNDKVNNGTTEDGGSISVSASAAMHQMVDSLVESEPAESCRGGDDVLTARQQPTSGRHTGYNDPNSMGNNIPEEPSLQYSPRPQLPSIMNTPFAPQPGEALSPTRPTTGGTIDRPAFPEEAPSSHNAGLGHVPLYHDLSNEKQLSTPTAPNSSFSLTQGSPAYPHGHATGSFQRPITMQLGCSSNAARPMQSPFVSSFSPHSGYGSSENINPSVNRVLLGETPPNGQGG